MEMEIIALKESLVEYLTRIEMPIWGIVKKYRIGEWHEIGEQMTMLVDGLSWIIDAVHLTKEYHSISVMDIREILEEITEALENEDTVLVADLLEYELIPKISKWRTQVASEKEYVS